MSPPVLSLRGVGKRFGAVAALVDVDLEVRAGEVHAVLGENGAGKSTLMNVIYGLIAPDAGALRLQGAPVRFASALDARRAGIGMVHQEFALADALSVAENLALSVCPGARWRWERSAVAAAVARLAGELGLDLGDLDAPVGTLAVGHRQRVEIVKALGTNPRILILDEPTAVLTPSEVSQLFAVLDRLRRAGTAVLFITHKLPEVMAIADRVSVMRRGRMVRTAERPAVSAADLATLMVGPLEPDATRATPPPAEAPVLLELRGLSAASDAGRPALADVSLTVRAGESVGIAGVDGNGQAELFEVLAGVRQPTGGSIAVGGVRLPRIDPAAMSAAGIACVPPDRQRQGIVAAMSVCENALLNAELRHRLAPGWLTHPAAEREAAQAMVDAYAIRTASLDAPAHSLSGGNVQKLIVARALALAPRVLVAANPTRGLDIAAARTVHGAFDAARRGGAAILLISTDLDELFAHADRVAVLYRGWLSAALERPFPTARIGALMAGTGDGFTAAET